MTYRYVLVHPRSHEVLAEYIMQSNTWVLDHTSDTTACAVVVEFSEDITTSFGVGFIPISLGLGENSAKCTVERTLRAAESARIARRMEPHRMRAQVPFGIRNVLAPLARNNC